LSIMTRFTGRVWLACLGLPLARRGLGRSTPAPGCGPAGGRPGGGMTVPARVDRAGAGGVGSGCRLVAGALPGDLLVGGVLGDGEGAVPAFEGSERAVGEDVRVVDVVAGAVAG